MSFKDDVSNCFKEYNELESQISSLQSELASTRERLEKAVEVIKSLRLNHYICEDGWYSCPLSSEGCLNENLKECYCPAETHNEKIETALKELAPSREEKG